MSAIGEALRTKLLTYSTVTDIIGQRMYPDVLVQNCTFPAVVYYVSYTEREHVITGLTKAAHARVSIDCYSNTRAGCSALSKAIRETGIDSFRGTVAGYTFCGIEYASGDEYYQETPTDGNQASRYMCSFDVVVHYKEI